MAGCLGRDRAAGAVNQPLVIEPEAAAELEDAVQWYKSRRAGLGLEFARVVRRFLYAASFVLDAERVTVIAIFHHRRDLAQWQVRR